MDASSLKSITDNIPIGALGTNTVTVTRDMTVAKVDASMPEVFATPYMIYLMETAAAEALQRYLPENWISVGAEVNIRHLFPTPAGFTVTVRAEIRSISEKLVTFAVEAHDGMEKIGEGTHIRGVVESERFMRLLRFKMRRKNKSTDHAS